MLLKPPLVRLLLVAAAACSGGPATAPSTGPVAAPTTVPARTEIYPATLPAETATWIRQLSDADWRKREKAQDALSRLDPQSAEPLLRDAARTAVDPESAARANAALLRMADIRLTGPTFVTLHRADAPAAEIFDELFRQAGATYLTQPAELFTTRTLPRASVAFDRVPFWEAMRQVCRQTGLNARHLHDRQRVTLIQEVASPMSESALTSVEGPLLIVAASHGFRRAPNMMLPPGERPGSLALGVLLEPRLRATSGWIEVERAVDQKGRSILGPAGKARSGWGGVLSGESTFSWRTDVPLSLADDATQAAEVKIRVHMMFQTHTERVEVPDVLKAREVEREAGGKRFILHGVNVTGDNYELRMTMFRDAMPEEEWRWFSYPYGKVRLIDAGGRDLNPNGGSGGGDGTQTEFRMTLRRDGAMGEVAGEPAKLVWELPIEVREVILPVITLRNMPIE